MSSSVTINKSKLLKDPVFYYYLGLMASDGNIYDYTARIELQYGDRKLLKQLRNHIRDNWTGIKPYYSKAKRKHGFTAKFNINNKVFVSFLKIFNIVPCKSLILSFPHNIPDKFMPHYIRGFFDGDGGISCRRNTYCVEFYSGSSNFLKCLNKFI